VECTERGQHHGNNEWKIALRESLDICMECFLAVPLIFEHFPYTSPHCNSVICKLFQHFYSLLVLVLSADVNVIPRFARDLFFIKPAKRAFISALSLRGA